jgi:hypothetical protein
MAFGFPSTVANEMCKCMSQEIVFKPNSSHHAPSCRCSQRRAPHCAHGLPTGPQRLPCTPTVLHVSKQPYRLLDDEYKTPEMLQIMASPSPYFWKYQNMHTFSSSLDRYATQCNAIKTRPICSARVEKHDDKHDSVFCRLQMSCLPICKNCLEVFSFCSTILSWASLSVVAL